MLVILVAFALATFGVVRLGRTLEPRQRVVLVLAFIFAVVYLLLKLVQMGHSGERHNRSRISRSDSSFHLSSGGAEPFTGFMRIVSATA